MNDLKEDQSFTFIDLFAGIGEIRLALEENGGKCVFSSEWNKYSRKTYEHNFGDAPAGDITQINVVDIPDHTVLAAGFPCQPFSITGISKKKSLNRPEAKHRYWHIQKADRDFFHQLMKNLN